MAEMTAGLFLLVTVYDGTADEAADAVRSMRVPPGHGTFSLAGGGEAEVTEVVILGEGSGGEWRENAMPGSPAAQALTARTEMIARLEREIGRLRQDIEHLEDTQGQLAARVADVESPSMVPVMLRHNTGSEGLPSDDLLQDGRVAFLWGTEVRVGEPAEPDVRGDVWETPEGERYMGVTHWLEFPASIGNLTHGIWRRAHG